MNFIAWAAGVGKVESHLQLMAHFENSLAVCGVEVYPSTLPDALRFASKFKPLTTVKRTHIHTYIHIHTHTYTHTYTHAPYTLTYNNTQ